jgi:hypothetical protein
VDTVEASGGMKCEIFFCAKIQSRRNKDFAHCDSSKVPEAKELKVKVPETKELRDGPGNDKERRDFALGEYNENITT